MRDSLGWKEIASYYIEALFYHESSKNEMKVMLYDPNSAFSNTQIFVEVFI